MGEIRMSGKLEKLEDLTPDPENANEGTARGASALETSMEVYGAGRSIAADRDGVVFAGNKTLEQAVAMGLKPRFVHTTGDELVVVVRDDLSFAENPAKVRGLAYADNRVGELSLKWNPDRVRKDLDEGLKFKPVFFTPEEIAERFTNVTADNTGEQSTASTEPPHDPQTCPQCGRKIKAAKEAASKTGKKKSGA
jgi:hypothetical protein